LAFSFDVVDADRIRSATSMAVEGDLASWAADSAPNRLPTRLGGCRKTVPAGTLR